MLTKFGILNSGRAIPYIWTYLASYFSHFLFLTHKHEGIETIREKIIWCRAPGQSVHMWAWVRFNLPGPGVHCPSVICARSCSLFGCMQVSSLGQRVDFVPT